MKQPPQQVAGQWVYDNMTHSQVERLTVDSSFPQTGTGTVTHERQECIPRSVKGAMAIVKAVKYKLKQLALKRRCCKENRCTRSLCASFCATSAWRPATPTLL